MSHEQNGEAVLDEQEQEVELTHEDRFSERFDEITSREDEEETTPDDEVAEEAPDSDSDAEPQEDEPTAQQSKGVEGPSPAMLAIAKQQGVPEKLLGTAVNDEQIGEWIEMLADSQATAPADPEPEFALELPDDEYPESDPVRKNLEGLHKHYQEKFTQQQAVLEKVMDVAIELGDKFDQFDKQAAQTEQKSFHDMLDGFQSDVAGQTASLSEDNDKLRGLIWEKFNSLKAELPSTPDKELIAKAARTYGVSSKTTQRSDALRKQAQTRLGGPESPKSAPEPKLSHKESFFQKFDEITKRSQS